MNFINRGYDFMRKISILNEDYMALEQVLAQVIDAAETSLIAQRDEHSKKLETVFEQVADQEQFHLDPAFINVKAEYDFGAMLEGAKTKLPEVVRSLKGLSEISLEKSAKISNAYKTLFNLSDTLMEDEVLHAVFFFGKEETNIPEATNNLFKVALGDSAIKNAITRLGEVNGVLSEVESKLTHLLANGGSKDELIGSVDKLVVIRELLSAF
jgi:hypothetical protein